MAVPTIPTPRVENRPQRLPNQRVEDTSGLAGEQGARDLAQLSESAGEASDALAQNAVVLQQADMRNRERQDALARLRTENEYKARAAELYTQFDQTGDLNDPEHLARFRTELNNLSGQVLQNYQPQVAGGLEKMATMVETARGAYERDAIQRSHEIGTAAIQRHVQQRVNELTSLVQANPAAMSDAQAEFLEDFATNAAPTMRPEEEEAAKQAGLQTIAMASVDHFIQLGQYDRALEQMNNPVVAPYLDAQSDAVRGARLKIYAGQGQAMKIKAEMDAKRQALGPLLDGLSSRDQVSILTGVSLPQLKENPVAEFERNAGRAATEEEIQILHGVRDKLSAEDNRGTSLEDIQSLIPKARNMTLSPAELDRFVLAASSAMETDQFGRTSALPSNVHEGLSNYGIAPHLIGTRQGVRQFQQAMDIALQAARPGSRQFPAAMADAMAQVEAGQMAGGAPAEGGAPATTAGDGGAEAPAEGGQDQQTTQVQQEAQQTMQDIDAVIGAAPNVPRDPEQIVRVAPSDASAIADAFEHQGTTLYDVADRVAGPLQAVQGGLARGVAGEIFPADAEVRAQLFTRLAVHSIPALIRTTERFANAEKEQLERMLSSLQPGFWNNPRGFQQSLIAVDEYLEFHQNSQEAEINSGTISVQKAREMADSVADIKRVRQLLGTPPLINSLGELTERIKSDEVMAGSIVYVAQAAAQEFGGRSGRVRVTQEVVDGVKGVRRNEEGSSQ